MSFSSSSPNADDTNTETELLRYKRLYSALQEQINSTQKRQKKSSATSTTQLGRGIRRVVSLFDDVADLVHHMDKHAAHLGGMEDEDDMELTDKSPDEISDLKRHRERCHIAVTQVLIRLVPNFLNKLDENTDPVALQEFYAQLQAGANDARGDDVLKVRAAVAKWLNEELPPPAPLLHPDSRSNRGIQHDVTGKLLCPIDFDWDDTTVRARLRNCEEGYNINSSFFLRCLYQSGTGDSNDVEEGFLKSGLLVKVFKYIFTSPSSANASVEATENAPIGNPAGVRTTHNAKRATRKNVSGCLHMEEKVTPRAIAYAAVQLVFALSDAPHWTAVHNGFDYRSFYYFVVDFFEVSVSVDKGSKERVRELLSWWNRRVFPTKHLSANAKSQQVTSNRKLAQQRAARAARNRLSGLV